MRKCDRISVLFFISAVVVLAQPQPPGPIVSYQGAMIDGSVTPGKIPDLVAWRMLFIVLADGPHAQSYSRRAAHLRDTGLSELEISQCIQAANVAAKRLTSGERKVQASSMPMDEKTQTLRIQRDRIIQEEVSELEKRLGFASALKLQAILQDRVKPRIRMTAEQ